VGIIKKDGRRHCDKSGICIDGYKGYVHIIGGCVG